MNRNSLLSSLGPVMLSLFVGVAMVFGSAMLGDIQAQEVGVHAERSAAGGATQLAKGLCGIWESARVTESCEVDAFVSRIDVTQAQTSAEALETCRETRNMLAKKTSVFENRGWRLRILDPNGVMLASCGLR